MSLLWPLTPLSLFSGPDSPHSMENFLDEMSWVARGFNLPQNFQVDSQIAQNSQYLKGNKWEIHVPNHQFLVSMLNFKKCLSCWFQPAPFCPNRANSLAVTATNPLHRAIDIHFEYFLVIELRFFQQAPY